MYLDAARFGAAAMVVVAHLLMLRLIDGPVAAFVPDLGREAVIVFFVLSGFVIKYSVEQKHASPRDYVVARCARIYSVALPVVTLAFVLVALVLTFSDVAVTTGYQVAKAYIYFPFHMLFAGEFWNLAETPPWLLPYWSLGYEVWYYALFGIAYYLSGARRLVLLAAVLLLVGFKLWMLLPVWLSGVWLYEWSKSHAVPPRWASAGWLLSLAALCVFKLVDADIYLRAYGSAIWPFPGLRLISADRYLADYAVCALVLINFACARSMSFAWLRKVKRPVRALAGHTFTLYLVHNLVLMAWKAFYPHNPANPGDLALLLFAVGVATYVLGFVTERRKGAFERLFRGLSERASRLVVPAKAGTHT
nr:acyltransferase [Massilia soli]